MALYGLDFLPEMDSSGKIKLWLAEINGVTSGIYPFRTLYGDRRVEEKVCSMLEDRYGRIQYLGASKLREILGEKKDNISKDAAKKFLSVKTPRGTWAYASSIEDLKDKLGSHSLAERWEIATGDDEENLFHSQFPFPVYDEKNPDAVLNPMNLSLHQRCINPHVPEVITRNKIFLYQTLRRTRFREIIPRTALVGLGIERKEELEILAKDNFSFVKKPLRGYQGKGFKLMGRERILQYKGTSNKPLFTGDDGDSLFTQDLLLMGNFLPEWYLAVVQPFIDTRKFADRFGGGYSSVRSVVCNGQFVDAFVRVGGNPSVSYSSGASAHLVEIDGLKSLSERVIASFDNITSKMNRKDFDFELYYKYLSKAPRGLLSTPWLNSLI